MSDGNSGALWCEVRSQLGPDVRMSTRAFSSGAVSSELSWGGRVVFVDATADGRQWWVCDVTDAGTDVDAPGAGTVVGSAVDAVAEAGRLLGVPVDAGGDGGPGPAR